MNDNFTLEDFEKSGLVNELGIKFGRITPGEYAEASMPITEKILQPFGIVHGGATLALLETVASLGAASSCDLTHEIPLGVEVSVRHLKSAREGTIHAVATFEYSEPSGGQARGIKQYWDVKTIDDAGDTLSQGTVVVKVIEKANCAE